MINLPKLFHQIFLVVKAARRITEEHIHISRLCSVYRVKNNSRQSVVLVIGVNGVGKTTTVGKLAGKTRRLKKFAI